MTMLGSAAAAALLASAASTAPVAPPPSAGLQTLTPESFAIYTPQTALDMVNRVPGFSLNDGEDRRGFSGSAGNVLVDGRRPATKSQSLRDVLGRIPAAQVARIELITGAAAAADAPGQAVLVNVVRKASGGAGSWELEGERGRTGRISPRGEASWAGRLAGLDLSAGLDAYFEHIPLSGEARIEGPGASLIARRADVSPRTYQEISGALSLGGPLFGGDGKLSFNANTSLFEAGVDARVFEAQVSPSPPGFDLQIEEANETLEWGADWTGELGPFGLNLVALHTDRTFREDSLRQDIGAPQPTAFDQRDRAEARETIARAAFSFAPTRGHALEFGAELARNTRDTSFVLTIDDGAAPRTIPASNVLVEEDRAEAFLTHSWRFGAGYSSELGLRWETSTIGVSGDSAAQRTLRFWKPSAQIARSFGERDQIRLKLFRDVDQLDFGDFASTAELGDGGRVVAGNPELQPSATWRAELALEKAFGARGAVSATVFREWISDAADLVPIRTPEGDAFDGPGNIGDGDAYGLELDASLPLDRLIPGGLFTASAELISAEVTDPVTGRAREPSQTSETELELEFRQDLPGAKLAWGLGLFKQSEFVFYRLSEVETYEEGPFVDAFIETTAVKGLKVRLFARNLADSEFVRDRSFFSPDRNGTDAGGEWRLRQNGHFIGLRAQGTF